MKICQSAKKCFFKTGKSKSKSVLEIKSHLLHFSCHRWPKFKFISLLSLSSVFTILGEVAKFFQWTFLICIYIVCTSQCTHTQFFVHAFLSRKFSLLWSFVHFSYFLLFSVYLCWFAEFIIKTGYSWMDLLYAMRMVANVSDGT